MTLFPATVSPKTEISLSLVRSPYPFVLVKGKNKVFHAVLSSKDQNDYDLPAIERTKKSMSAHLSTQKFAHLTVKELAG